MDRRGFTLIELVLVISILGILSISALPKFIDITTKAHEAARDGVVGAVRSGIDLVRCQNVVIGGSGGPPAALDSDTGPACATCFSSVLVNPIGANTGWNHTGVLYTHTPTNTTYTYDSSNGTFQ